MSHIDYSALRPNIKNDRWSPLATLIYAVTAIVLSVTIAIVGAAISHFTLPGIIPLLAGVVISGLCIMASRAFFHRVSPARVDDLVAFAAMNSLTIQSSPPVNSLSSVVRVLLKYAPLYPPRPWRYTVDLQLGGTYRDYPIALHNISLDPGIITDSAIEEGVAEVRYEQIESQTSITLTIHQATSGANGLAARHRGVITWILPAVSPNAIKKIQHLADWHAIDAQTNGHQLALLLPSTLPYDRKGMTRLYRLLDRIHDIAIR